MRFIQIFAPDILGQMPESEEADANACQSNIHVDENV